MDNDDLETPTVARKTLSIALAGLCSLLLVILLAVPLERAELPEIFWFAGRLHPLILHLGIGFLIALFAMEVLAKVVRGRDLGTACVALAWLTVLSLVPIAVCGVLLATEGGYADEPLWRHRWLGGALAIASLWLLVLRPRVPREPWRYRIAYGLVLGLSLALVGAAGHYGASLTHGSNYLTQYAPTWLKFSADEPADAGEPRDVGEPDHAVDSGRPDPAGVQAEPAGADLFADVVQPVFLARCTTCHGETKQKAKLRVDDYQALVVGSEYGPVLDPGDPGASRLLEVLALPLEDVDHMPPEGRQQLTEDEHAAIVAWVEAGFPESAPLAQLDVPETSRAVFGRLLESDSGAPGEPETLDATEDPVDAGEPGELGDTSRHGEPGGAALASLTELDFHAEIEPLVAGYCYPCHGEMKQKGSVRLDVLDPDLVNGADAEKWHAALDMINGAEMPPEDAEQPTDDERRKLVSWLTSSLEAAAQARQGERKSVLRRLTKAQYTYTLQELLGLGIDFGRPLPSDGKSELGFTNSGAVLQASPLHIDTYQRIARSGLLEALPPGLDGKPPEPTRYRVTFGQGIGRGHVAGHTGGYQSVPLSTDDFLVEILDARGAPKEPEDGLAGEEQRRVLDGIRKRISVGLRGSSQDRFRVVAEGMLLYAAVPHKEKVPAAWQGPSPNLKLEMQRCFPERGDFVMRVRASRGYLLDHQDEMLVALEDRTPRAVLEWPVGPPLANLWPRDASDPVAPGEPGIELAGPRASQDFDRDLELSVFGAELTTPEASLVLLAGESDENANLERAGDFLVPEELTAESSARVAFSVPVDGWYQVDLVHPSVAPEMMPSVRLWLRDRTLDLRPEHSADELSRGRVVTTLGAAYLRGGKKTLKVGGAFFVGFSHLVVTPLEKEHPLVVRLQEKTSELAERVADAHPSIRALVGTRTDDGMDYQTFAEPQEVRAPLGMPETYSFHGRLENLPIPEPESGDREILSGFMLLGLWNDHLVKSRDEQGPPLLVESIEFEAPHHPVWPPESYRRIFFRSQGPGESEADYTRAILARFVDRAFRRTVTDVELDRYLEFWSDVRDHFGTNEEAVREVLVAVLCSPNFLYLAQPDDAASEEVLATRLAYFLWNSPPDDKLRELARRGELTERLSGQIDRMLDDPRAWRFVRAFTHEWLRLDRHELMSVDADRHPSFTRFVKRDLAEETYQFVHRVISEDRSILELISSDVALLNQNLAEFYGVDALLEAAGEAPVRGARFRPVSLPPEILERARGGLLTQAAFLSGHSDGRQAHPIKRAVWLKEKLLGEKPPPPPPNVPDLDPETPGFENLSLKEQLEAHRSKASCQDCHRSIDPYGIVFEQFNAAGLFQPQRGDKPVDASSTLPDGTPVEGVLDLQRHIVGERADQFARALVEHLFAYANGRDLHFADEKELLEILQAVQSEDYRSRAMIESIVKSPSFLTL